jgi:hypothetical protein
MASAPPNTFSPHCPEAPILRRQNLRDLKNWDLRFPSPMCRKKTKGWLEDKVESPRFLEGIPEHLPETSPRGSEPQES